MGLMRNHHNEHYPAWLEENWLFKKLFVLRMLLRRRPRQHHGLPFERQFLKNSFPKNYQGFYVDVGCYHTVKENNTWLMYKNGWSGINIDLEKIKIDAFKLRRPRDINIHTAVSDQPGKLRYFSTGIWSGATGAAREGGPSRTNIWAGADEAARKEGAFRTIEKTAPTDTLSNIIDATKYCDRPIDFLTVDVEGHELQVLRSLDFARYQPRFVVVESWLETMDEIFECELYRFMKQQSYELVNWMKYDLIFRRRETTT